MKQYSILRALLMSFYSPSLYRDVAMNWRGIGFTYLFVLMIIVSIPAAFGMYILQHDFEKESLPGWMNQMPTITINKGELSIDRPVPYLIKNPDNGEIVAIIDTSGKYTTFENTTAAVLVTNKMIYVKKNEREMRSYDISGMNDTTLTKEDVQKIIDKVSTWVPFGSFVIFVLFGCLYRVLQMLIYAGLGMIVAKIFRADVSYQSMMRIAIVAITPVVIISTITDMFNVEIPYGLAVWFLLAMFYISFGAFANRKSAVEKQSPMTPAG